MLWQRKEAEGTKLDEPDMQDTAGEAGTNS